LTKLVCFSDTHTNFDFFVPKADIILFAGDMSAETPMRFYRFLKWFSGLDARYKVIVAGNHDIYIEKNTSLAREDFKINNVIYLENELVEIEGIKIWGGPYSPAFCDWGYQLYTVEQSREIWSKIPENTDIVLTHSPPLGILDQTCQGQHVGDRELLKRVKEVKPKYSFFGHEHNNGGKIYQEDGITFANLSLCNDFNSRVRKPLEFNI
jgi:Icc-related predicted phosphoesterase